ncbi:Uncharacterized protein TPAR_05302 [Tolypocladium paradoxum]|uniref:Uncharacterized protein n=1 Tax=Tolypocladium paradoxum TaxID=94208 RepID=A0A2S4KWD1_9HYPO|nr:Uncharacterized protein TPAR_05302 [Tolypocladium paradoxum]
MIKHPGHVCRGQGGTYSSVPAQNDAVYANLPGSRPLRQKCQLLVDKDGKIRPAARAVAAASVSISRGEEVPDYEALATKYNLLARREAKRRSPGASGSNSAGASNDALATLLRRQNDILLGIRAELGALRERAGAKTPPAGSEEQQDDFGLYQDMEND